jgi:hypothetical protein
MSSCKILYRNYIISSKRFKENIGEPNIGYLKVIEDYSHIEMINKEHSIKSDIQWVSDCEYNLTIKETTLPRFPFKIGSKLHIVITKVKGNKVYYTSMLGGKTWEGKLTKRKNQDKSWFFLY